MELGQEIPLPSMTVYVGTQSDTPSIQSFLFLPEFILVDEHSPIKNFDIKENRPVESESIGAI